MIVYQYVFSKSIGLLCAYTLLLYVIIFLILLFFVIRKNGVIHTKGRAR